MSANGLIVLLPALALAVSAQADPPKKGGSALPFSHLYVDLDGTLLSSTSEVPRLNVRAIRRFRKLGGHVGIATGRLPERGLRYAAVIDTDLPLIFGNGAVITDRKGQALAVYTVDEAVDLKAMCAAINAAKCGRVYTAMADRKTGRITVHGDRCVLPRSAAEGVVKLRAVRCKRHSALLAQVKAAAKGPCEVLESGTGAHLGVSVGPLEASKATALRWVAARERVKLSQMAFFGDSGNDTAALKAVRDAGGTCFAMSNGGPEVKAACPRQTPVENDEGGVGRALLGLMP